MILNPDQCSDIGAYHKFLLNYQKKPHVIHAFYEGSGDESFYGHIIRKHLAPETTLYTYQAKGKKYVIRLSIQICKKINSDQSNDRTLFFIDKDIDDIVDNFVPPSEIYQTTYYSIENYLVTREIYEIYLVEILKMGAGHEKIGELLDKFSNELRIYHVFGTDFMKWIIWLRTKGQRPNLNNLKNGTLCEFRPAGILHHRLTKERIAILDSQLGVSTDYSTFLKEKKTIAQKITSIATKSVLRGKNEMGFFIGFLKYTIDNALSLIGHAVKCKHSLSNETVIDIFGPRVVTPPDLNEYIAKRV